MIYFLKHVATGLIKIGYTNKYHDRHRVLTKKYGAMKLIGRHDGDITLETRIHSYLSPFNVENLPHPLEGDEWFYPVQDVLLVAETCEITPRSLEKKPPTTGIVKTVMIYIAPLLEANGETVANVARKLGLPSATLNRYANGSTSFKGDTVVALMNYFNCEMIDLFKIETKPTSK